MKTQTLLLIPAFVEDTIKAKGKDLSVAFDVNKLLDILSETDVAFYVALNRVASKNLPDYLIESYPLYSLSVGSDTLEKTIERVLIEQRQFKDAKVLLEACGRTTDSDNPIVGFEPVRLYNNTLLLRLRGVGDELEFMDSFDALIKKIMETTPLEEMAKTPLFNAYEMRFNERFKKVA